MSKVLRWMLSNPKEIAWIWWPQVAMSIVGALLLAKLGSGAYFVDLLTWHAVEASPIKLTVLLAWGTCLACGLIVANTWGFLIDLGKLEPRPKHRVWTSGLCVVSIGLAALWWFLLNLCVRETLLGFFHDKTRAIVDATLDDVLISVIFGLFCVIDLAIIRGIDGDKCDVDQRAIRRTSIGALLYVEGPVVLGVALIAALRWIIGHNDAAGDLTKTAFRVLGGATADGRKMLDDVYVRGLATGALLMHVVLSQMVFGLVRTREEYECSETKRRCASTNRGAPSTTPGGV